MYRRTMLSSRGMTMMEPWSEWIVHFILMSGKFVRTTPSITPQTWAMGSLCVIPTPSFSLTKLLAPSPLKRYFALTVSMTLLSKFLSDTSTGYLASFPVFSKSVMVHGLSILVPFFSTSSMNTRSIRPWWRSAVNGYRASRKLGQLAHVPVRAIFPFSPGAGSQKATSKTLAGSYAIILRLRPRLRSISSDRGCIPSARPVAVGTGRLSMCLIL